jgi:hypothetical protein
MIEISQIFFAGFGHGICRGRRVCDEDTEAQSNLNRGHGIEGSSFALLKMH